MILFVSNYSIMYCKGVQFFSGQFAKKCTLYVNYLALVDIKGQLFFVLKGQQYVIWQQC